MANNILAGKLNFVPYLSDTPGRLTGTLQTGEKSLASVLTPARIKTIYLPNDSGGFNAFNPASPTFSSLKVLQPGSSYAIEAKESFEFEDALPPATETFTNNLLDWFETNTVSDSSNNFVANKLNIFVYASKRPGRLTGTVGANEEDLRSVFTAARVSVIYLASDVGGFNAYNPANPTFSPLKVLQPGVAYAVGVIQSFNYGKTVPPPSTTFKNNLITYFRNNRPSSSGSGTRKALGSNITGIRDFQSEIHLKDIFKRARTWISNANGVGFGQGGALDIDTNGWIRSLNTSTGQSASTPLYILPVGATKTEGLYPTGQYVITYDGEGALSFPVSDVTNVVTTPNRITLQYNGGDFWVGVTQTNPANYVRNIKVFWAADESTLSNPWNQTFLDRMGIFKTIRFMDFLSTNNSTLSTWAGRPKTTDYTYATDKGAPIELAIDLCNRLDADGWFCIPANADNDYIQQFAQLIFTTLKPGLNIWIEYSNEIWNGIFGQFGTVLTRANQFGIAGNDFDKVCRYQGRRSVEIFNIFESVFGGLSRIRRVVGSQFGNGGVTDLIVNWNDPTVGLVKEKVDYIAYAPYFNGLDHPSDVSVADLNTLTTASMLAKMNADIDLAKTKWMVEKNRISNSRGAIPIVAYEGGQHLNPNSFPDDPSRNQALALYRPLQNSQAMYDAYVRYFGLWFADMGDNALFCHFSSIYYPTKFGFWGMLETNYQAPASAAKYRALQTILSQGSSSGTVNVASAAAGSLTVSWSGIAANTNGTVSVASSNPGSLTVTWSGVTPNSASPSPSPTPTPPVNAARSAVPAGTVLARWSAGNSVTDTVDYTGLNKLSVEAGYPGEKWGRLTIPGAPIDFIRDNPNTGITSGNPTNPGLYNDALTAFTWDHISFQPFDRSIAQDNSAIQSFIDLYKTASPNAQLWIYARWPLRSATQSENTAQSWRDKWNSTAASTVYPTGQTTKSFFENLTNTVRSNNPTLKKPLIIPVGHVMTHLHERLVAGEVAGYSSIWDIYQGADPSTPNDTVHLNDGAGSYLAACTYYSSIYFRSPVGLSRPAEYLTFSDQMRAAIQESVWAVVSTYSYTNGNY